MVESWAVVTENPGSSWFLPMVFPISLSGKIWSGGDKFQSWRVLPDLVEKHDKEIERAHRQSAGRKGSHLIGANLSQLSGGGDGW